MTYYKLRRDKLFCKDAGHYIGYGMDIYNTKTKELIRSIKDICLKREHMKLLISKCNKLQPDIIYIDDIIEDFLVEYSKNTLFTIWG